MPNYYPIAGSQRMRVMWEIVRKQDGWMFKTMNVKVADLKKNGGICSTCGEIKKKEIE
jgi:hypothetical protein